MTVNNTANSGATVAIHSGGNTATLTDAVTAYASYGLGHVVAGGRPTTRGAQRFIYLTSVVPEPTAITILCTAAISLRRRWR